jgi:hypothetical protein
LLTYNAYQHKDSHRVCQSNYVFILQPVLIIQNDDNKSISYSEI